MPANGPLLLVTRPQPQADEWVGTLHGLGCRAAALPLLDLAPPGDDEAVQAAWQGLARHVCVMFVSPSAADRFFAQRPAHLAWPVQVQAAATGPGTVRALLRAGLLPQQLIAPPDDAAQFDSEALWHELAQRGPWDGRSVLIVRGQGGRDWLAQTWRQAGASVHTVEAYRRTTPVLTGAGQALLAAALDKPADHVWLFSSSEAAGQLRHLAPQARWAASRALATHPRIADAVRELGFGQVLGVAPAPQAVAHACAMMA